MFEESKTIPEEFKKVIKDLVTDLKITFPEYVTFINKWWKENEYFNYIDEEEERNLAIQNSENQSIQLLFEFCQKKIPPRFFDILYQNEDIFKMDSNIDTEFLPNIHFKNLWQYEISEKTRETIWKYLQLINFSIVGTLNNKDAFGDTAKLFEAINEDEFKNKLQETLSHMHDFFDFSMNLNEDQESFDSTFTKENMPNIPNIPDINKMQEHISGMLDGKLGKLAREIAEETASNLNMDFDESSDMKDIFNNLIKNPTKLMDLVKSIGTKLDSKIKSGDIKESELISEASEMMNKMKNMPGMGNIQSMLSKMGLSGMVDGKVNTAAMEAQLNNKMKLAKTKERIRAKAEANQKARLEEQLKNLVKQQQENQSENFDNMQERLNKQKSTEEELIKLFSSGEKNEKTPRGVKHQNNDKKSNKKDKKQNK